MISVILHMDDQSFWLDAVKKQVQAIQAPGREIRVLPRVSIPEARSVIEGKDLEMRGLLDQGCRLNAVIMDLMMDGGTLEDLSNWLAGVRLLAGKLPKGKEVDVSSPPLSRGLAEVDEKCPALPVGRLAAARGAKVVILTNCRKILRESDLDLRTERRLIMAASGASEYIAKTDDTWLDSLRKALRGLPGKPAGRG